MKKDLSYSQALAISEELILHAFLRKTLVNFIEDFIEDKHKDEFKKNAFIAGGCFANLVNKNFGDIDIFLKDPKFATKIQNYYENDVTDNERIITTNNAITFLHDDSREWTNFTTIQVITKWSGKPKEIVENFDFKHLQNYYDLEKDKLKLKLSVIHLKSKESLEYTGSKYPLSSLFRLKKFIAKGYIYKNEELAKIIADVLKLDLSTKEKIREQCTGLYSETTEAFIDTLLTGNSSKTDVWEL